MAKKNHGVFLGLLLGSAAATIAYLSLSSSKKDQLLKESAKKIEDLNTCLLYTSDAADDWLVV